MKKKKILVTEDYLSNVANSIRNKNKTETKYKPEDMSAAIDNIVTPYAPRFISFREYKGSELNNELLNLDTSNLSTMATMFYYCDNLVILNVSNFNTNNVNNMRYMFYSCNHLINLDLSNFDTSKVTDMSYMFANCEKLQTLDIRNFNFSNVTTHAGMFNSVPSDCLIIVADDAAKRWILNKFDRLTNVKTIGEFN